ncbi:MAG: hypothetical protein ACTS68_01715 [Candidatus Hodgkinia cicadicola]
MRTISRAASFEGGTTFAIASFEGEKVTFVQDSSKVDAMIPNFRRNLKVYRTAEVVFRPISFGKAQNGRSKLWNRSAVTSSEIDSKGALGWRPSVLLPQVAETEESLRN